MARIQKLIEWIETLPTITVRLWMLVGVAIGGFLVFGVYPLFG